MIATAPRCPACGEPVPQRWSASGRRSRGRPRVFCSDPCRRGGRRHAPADPARRRAEREVFAAAVRAAITASGLPLRELTVRLAEAYGSLASSVATLSAWQTGSSAPPGTPAGVDRVLALERCLGRPAGDLALLVPGGALPSSGRPDRPGHPGRVAGRQARARHVAALLAGDHQVVPVTIAKDRRLGTDRQSLHTAVHLRIRALAEGVDRFWYVHSPDPRLRPRPRSGPGCRVGREVRVPPEEPSGAPLLAVEFVLSRTLRRGEHHDLAFEVDYESAGRPGQVPASVFRHVQPQPCERLDLSVSFPRGETPAEMLQVRWRQRDLTEVWRARTTLSGCRQYRQVVDDPTPGGYGYRWAWPRPAAAAGRRAGHRAGISAA
ncbi:MAG TPA: hypothetical protein VF109_11385 [Mycobacteriales bacterium]